MFRFKLYKTFAWFLCHKIASARSDLARTENLRFSGCSKTAVLDTTLACNNIRYKTHVALFNCHPTQYPTGALGPDLASLCPQI